METQQINSNEQRKDDSQFSQSKDAIEEQNEINNSTVVQLRTENQKNIANNITENGENDKTLDEQQSFCMHVDSVEKIRHQKLNENMKQHSIASHQRQIQEEAAFLYENIQLGFDILAPAQIYLAEQHRKAKKIKIIPQQQSTWLAKSQADKKSIINIKKCPCCNMPLEGERMKINCNLSCLYQLGEGYPLYFMYIKYTIVILLLAFLP